MPYFCHVCDREVPHAMHQENGELLCSVCLEPYVEIREEMEVEEEPEVLPQQNQQRQEQNEIPHRSMHYEVTWNHDGVGVTHSRTFSSTSANGGAMPHTIQNFFTHVFEDETTNIFDAFTQNQNQQQREFFEHSQLPQFFQQAEERFGSFGMQGGFRFVNDMNMQGGAQAGDFFTGNLAQWRSLLNAFHQRHNNGQQGKPPASEEAITRLKTEIMTAETAKTCSEVPCAICQDEYKENEEVVCLPCGHKYHQGCVVPWLQRHCTCPVCRYEVKEPEEEDHPAAMPTESVV